MTVLSNMQIRLQPDERSGEAVKLFAVKKGDTIITETIIAFCNENLTGYKVPRSVEFLSDLPKSAVCKILRPELREPSSKEAV